MRLKPELEVIGDPECPLIHRWTLLKWGSQRKGSERYRRAYAHINSGVPEEVTGAGSSSYTASSRGRMTATSMTIRALSGR